MVFQDYFAMMTLDRTRTEWSKTAELILTIKIKTALSCNYWQH